MFALSTIIEDVLYSLQEKEGLDNFHECFENWNDVCYLYDFFKQNPKVLQFYGLSIPEAVEVILDESNAFFEDILVIAENKESEKKLDNSIFEPLFPLDDFNIPILKTKAYGKPGGISFLRLYAIRLTDGTYIVVGGLIKTTQKMQDCQEGNLMLKKLKKIADLLQKNGLMDLFDLSSFID